MMLLLLLLPPHVLRRATWRRAIHDAPMIR